MKSNQHNMKPLWIFFLLSLLFVTLLAFPGILLHYGLIQAEIPFIPLVVLGSWTPNIAAFLVIAFVIKQKGGIRKLFNRWTMWKAPIWWYLVAASPLLISAVAALLYHLIDAQSNFSGDRPEYAMLFAFLILSLITGAMGEELGWRGFALPWVQTKFNALFASLIIGLVWGIWHLPLWFTGMGWEDMSFWLFTYNCIAMSVIFTWICNSTRGNMVLVTLFHMFYNFGFGLMGELWNVPADKGILYLSIMLTLYATAILIVYGPVSLSKNRAIPVDKNTKEWIT